MAAEVSEASRRCTDREFRDAQVKISPVPKRKRGNSDSRGIARKRADHARRRSHPTCSGDTPRETIVLADLFPQKDEGLPSSQEIRRPTWKRRKRATSSDGLQKRQVRGPLLRPEENSSGGSHQFFQRTGAGPDSELNRIYKKKKTNRWLT